MENENENETQEILIDHYELLYILPMSLTEAEVKPIIEKVNKKITEKEGQITHKENLGKLKLAYTINNLSHGYYILAEFDIPKENLAKINRSLGLLNEIVRFIIVKKKIKTEQEIKQEKVLQEKLTKKKEKEIEKIQSDKKESKETTTKDKDKGKVSIEELDKKLDEILDTDEIL